MSSLPGGAAMTCSVTTLGCRVNQYESDRLMTGLRRYGVVDGGTDRSPDILIVNTCAVTKVSDRKSRKMIRRVVREAAGSFIVVTGCYAELEAEEIRAVEGVDLVAGNDDKEALPERIAGILGLAAAFGASSPEDSHAAPRIRALLKVQDGCDAFCSYCTVPYARGNPRSRPLEECIAEAAELVAAGARELVLTGVHLGKYGVDNGSSVAALVEALLKQVSETELLRLRLSSLEITEVDQDLRRLLAEEPRLCRHLHLPLQSGSDRVLERMGRNYTGKDFTAAAKELAADIPGIAISTDVIVGFPGEGEEDLQRTKEVIRESRICRLHVFPFSARDLAPASKFPDQVREKAKLERAHLLNELGGELRRDYHGRFVGEPLTFLAEKCDDEARTITGLTDNYLRVRAAGAEDQLGDLVTVTSPILTPDGFQAGYVQP